MEYGFTRKIKRVLFYTTRGSKRFDVVFGTGQKVDFSLGDIANRLDGLDPKPLELYEMLCLAIVKAEGFRDHVKVQIVRALVRELQRTLRTKLHELEIEKVSIYTRRHKPEIFVRTSKEGEIRLREETMIPLLKAGVFSDEQIEEILAKGCEVVSSYQEDDPEYERVHHVFLKLHLSVDEVREAAVS